MSLKMIEAIELFSRKVEENDRNWNPSGTRRSKILNRSAVGIEHEPAFAQHNPKLIITSPPYPGVHVLYHRWQVLGRRETPAPYWIANTLDGNGEAYYTFGGRHKENLDDYFSNAYRSFSSLAKISNKDTLIVQVVGFSELGWQLPLYLETLEEAGLSEARDTQFANHDDGRLWRQVPNRKWFASQRGATHSSKEVILFHRLS